MRCPTCGRWLYEVLARGEGQEIRIRCPRCRAVWVVGQREQHVTIEPFILTNRAPQP